MIAVNVEAKLGVNKYFVDEEHAHIVMKNEIAPELFRQLEKACPAGLYSRAEDGSVRFDYAGCLECGTCRILAGTTLLESWQYPMGGKGVELRYG